MSKDVRVALSQLENLPLASMLSAGAMPMLTFGIPNKQSDEHHTSIESNTFQLHIQCPWRFISGTSVVVGSSDYYARADESESSESKAYDYVIERGFAHIFNTISRNDLKVSQAVYGELGDLSIHFCGGARLEIFCTASHDRENWRLFKTGDEDVHLVCSASKLGAVCGYDED